MRTEVRAEMRRQEVMTPRRARTDDRLHTARAAGLRLLETYTALAERGAHLFGPLLAGHAPRQWAHYPEDDAIDRASGYQWFYHSHSPQDRPGAVEHGHIHLFARHPRWSRRLRSRAEQAFAALCGHPQARPSTRHLLTIAFDAKGVPISLFTVNSWVTGDLMLGAALTLELLDAIRLDTGHAEVDAVIESVTRLCQPELRALMARRDEALRAHAGPNTLADPALEVLSEVRIDLDARLQELG